MSTYKSEIKLNDRVLIDECYLQDECTAHFETTPKATVESEPSDEEELVCIQYDNGLLDYVPQNILTKIELRYLVRKKYF